MTAQQGPSKPTVPQVLPIAVAYYSMPGHGVGGSLHIVLNDQNVDDSHVEFCIKYAQEDADPEGEALGEVLLRMSKTQRRKLSNAIPWIEGEPGTVEKFWTAYHQAFPQVLSSE